jgi:hypothetical protein
MTPDCIRVSDRHARIHRRPSPQLRQGGEAAAVKDIDAEVMGWLKRAYALDA